MTKEVKLLKDVSALTEKYSIGEVRRVLRELVRLNRLRAKIEDTRIFIDECNEAKIEVPFFVTHKLDNLIRQVK